MQHAHVPQLHPAVGADEHHGISDARRDHLVRREHDHAVPGGLAHGTRPLLLRQTARFGVHGEHRDRARADDRLGHGRKRRIADGDDGRRPARAGLRSSRRGIRLLLGKLGRVPRAHASVAHFVLSARCAVVDRAVVRRVLVLLGGAGGSGAAAHVAAARALAAVLDALQPRRNRRSARNHGRLGALPHGARLAGQSHRGQPRAVVPVRLRVADDRGFSRLGLRGSPAAAYRQHRGRRGAHRARAPIWRLRSR